MRKYLIKVIGLSFAILFVYMFANIDVATIFTLEQNSLLTMGNFETISNDKTFGKFVTSSLNENTWSVGGVNKTNTKLIIKLFGFIPIKTVDVVVCDDKQVYIGGVPLGFAITTKGVIVVGQNSVLTEQGNLTPNQSNKIRVGDILLKVNGVSIENASEIHSILSKSNGEPFAVVLLREGKEIKSEITPLKDQQSGEYKLGLWVRNDAQGIGTLTYVTNENKFGALGHAITDYETGIEIPIENGKIYDCTTVGITKGKKGVAGELRCLFIQGEKNVQGGIVKNSKYGVFGEMNSNSKLIDENLCAEIGTRMVAKMGNAKIISSANGIRQEYDIEIIKTYHQNSSNDKSLIFRVTDNRLLQLTGGIVQGMSGSPIVQNGKLIGAVTHVFLNDPTKGYGVYLDWMLNEM